MNLTRFSRATDVFNLYFKMSPQPGLLLQNHIIAEVNPAFEQLTKKKKGYLINHSIAQVMQQQKGEPLLNLIIEQENGETDCLFSIGSDIVKYNCKWNRLYDESEETTLVLFEQMSRPQVSAYEKELINDLHEQRDLIALIIETDEYERKKISDFLHDEVGSLMASCKHQLDLSLFSNQGNNNRSAEELKKGIRMLDESIKMLRHIAMHTAPVSYEFGLVNAIQNLVESVNYQGDTLVKFIPVTDSLNLKKSLEITIYRIIQELLQNSIKHASATEIILQLYSDQHGVTITYEDNGKGFDYNKELKKQNAIGLKKINQRVGLFDGKMQIDSFPNQGTVITIDLLLRS